jgi:excisionase family DNA binding protein
MSELKRELEQLVNYEGAAKILGVSIPTVKRMVCDGAIDVIRVGQRSTRFEPSALKAFIDSKRDPRRTPTYRNP